MATSKTAGPGGASGARRRGKAADGAGSKGAGSKGAGSNGAQTTGASRRLVIVESPTKARKIAPYLGSNYVVESSRG
ncbi:MAG: hypothetical protein ACRDTZ_13805, partial [Pseudonocardiaceae bacterium]